MKFGNKNIQSLCYGSKGIVKAMFGSKLIWEKSNVEDYINMILESTISGNELNNMSTLLTKINNSNQDFTYINSKLEKIINGSELFFDTIPVCETMPGDICIYDNVTDKKLFVSNDYHLNEVPVNRFTPIGIVVVPGIHAVYGANSCGIISLVGMSCNSPSNGTIGNDDTMCFAPQTDIGPLKNYNVVIVEDGSGGLKTNGFGYLSKNGNYVSTTLRIPDPYLSDMSRNPDYHNTSISVYNAMADFNGRANSNAVLSTRGNKDYNTWVPTSTTGTDYAAVSCCDMFFTEGTSQGDWYLPGAGELGYMMSKWDIIRNSFTSLNDKYGNICKQLEDNSSYWTSSEHNAKNTRYVHTDNGMGHTTKTTSCKVRAFTVVTE